MSTFISDALVKPQTAHLLTLCVCVCVCVCLGGGRMHACARVCVCVCHFVCLIGFCSYVTSLNSHPFQHQALYVLFSPLFTSNTFLLFL